MGIIVGMVLGWALTTILGLIIAPDATATTIYVSYFIGMILGGSAGYHLEQ